MTQPLCAGDCDGSAAVTIDELVNGVGVAIADRPLAECEIFDANGDARLAVDELVAAVGNALRGCRPGA